MLGVVSDCSEGCVVPEPPHLPEFVDRLRVRDISTDVEAILALYLDLPGVGTSLKNWESLADALGMHRDHIIVRCSRYIECSTACPPDEKIAFFYLCQFGTQVPKVIIYVPKMEMLCAKLEVYTTT